MKLRVTKNCVDVISNDVRKLRPAVVKILLSDKTTRGYIHWANNNYVSYGGEFGEECEIRPELFAGVQSSVVQPRVKKEDAAQARRTRESAEVFTPAWICNEQNNLIDAAWFGRENVFNYTDGKRWFVNQNPIAFPEKKTWRDYVDSKRMEVTCGEAPYLVSRYDAVSGQEIPIIERIGLLDRKLRVVNENITNEAEWYEWAIRAFQSSYAYDYQGDNVLLARLNLLYTFIENMIFKFGHGPDERQIARLANIIAWNVWQMDGITMSVPFYSIEPPYEQMTLFDGIPQEQGLTERKYCKIFDWRSNHSLEFRSLLQKEC